LKKYPKLFTVLGAALLVAVGTTGFLMYGSEHQKRMALEEEMKILRKQSNESAVMQSINAQMEEIASEERRISDEQRDAARQQTRVAEQERQNAEQQRRQAEQERQNAIEAEHRAIEASEVAKRERLTAEQQRSQAELSKRVTDTLNYTILARTLGTKAITQYYSGSHELAELLAYTATMFTERYHGDIYSTTIYQSLAMTSQNKTVWNKHKGSLTDIAFYDNLGNDFVTCSTYGQVFKNRVDDDKMQSETLINDPNYDFRDVYIDRKQGIVYAVSRTSHLFVIGKGGTLKLVPVNVPNLIRIEPSDESANANVNPNGKYYILYGERGMALFDATSNTIISEKQLPYKVMSISLKDNVTILFDDQGQQHQIFSFDDVKTTPVPVSGQVTAYDESEDKRIMVYGMNDGTIYLIKQQEQVTKLTGHRSRISKIKINGQRLYTASYDGTMNLWLTNMAKIEPMGLFTTQGWIINFTFDNKRIFIWTGDQNGNLTRALISVPTMIERLKNKLKRNFTREEWDYYVGNNIPYEKIKD